MVKILVAYASKYQATAEIAQVIADMLENNGHTVDVQRVVNVVDLSEYDAVLVGSAIYAGQWMGEAVDFLNAQRETLAHKPTWIFSSGPTGEGDASDLFGGSSYPPALKPQIEAIAPRNVVLFHGSVDDTKINTTEKKILASAQKPGGDFRDWESIKQWAVAISSSLD